MTARSEVSATASERNGQRAPFDVEAVRADFPILTRTVRGGQPLVYLDSANTSQKPRQVVDTMSDFFERHNANIHRATHELGEEATEAYEGARIKVAQFIGAADEAEVVFTKNISEAINLVAYSMGNATAAPGPRASSLSLREGDEIVITEMEHHSNIVPWQLLSERTGASLRWFGVTADGRLDLARADELITPRTRIVALTHQSNVLGTVNPVADIAARAHAVGALVLVDAAQSAPHGLIDVRALGADLVGFTGHKMCGPTGIGALWGRRDLLEEMPPFLGGGEMIESVWMDHSTFAPPPHKFEAGTMPIGEAVGLAAAIDYLNGVGLDRVREHEQDLLRHALAVLSEIDGLRILGPAEPVDRGGAISFTLDGIHPHDVSQVLDDNGVAVRAGHHCAWPLHRALGVQSSVRASLYLYNTHAEIDALAEGIRQTQKFFGTA